MDFIVWHAKVAAKLVIQLDAALVNMVSSKKVRTVNLFLQEAQACHIKAV